MTVLAEPVPRANRTQLTSTQIEPSNHRQPSFWGSLEPQLQDLSKLERRELDSTAWIELGRDVIHGSDRLFDELSSTLNWQQYERPMYDRIVPVPRLTATVAVSDPTVPEVLKRTAQVLGHRFERDFHRIGANLYRDGNDSVAWHGDTIGRQVTNPTIAILSLGGSRVFRLRPAGGGRGTAISLHSGDLLVMGGACQHTWEHAVLKVARAEPRISVTFRHDRSDETEGPSWPVSV